MGVLVSLTALHAQLETFRSDIRYHRSARFSPDQLLCRYVEISKLLFASPHLVFDAKGSISGVSHDRVFCAHSARSLLRTKAVSPSPSGARGWHVDLACHWKVSWYFMVLTYLKCFRIVELWASAIRTLNCC